MGACVIPFSSDRHEFVEKKGQLSCLQFVRGTVGFTDQDHKMEIWVLTRYLIGESSYLFGYWKSFTRGMHFGPRCDKKFCTKWETRICALDCW